MAINSARRTRKRCATLTALAGLAALSAFGPAIANGQTTARLTEIGRAENPTLSDAGRWAVVPTTKGMVILDGATKKLACARSNLVAPCGGPQGGIPHAAGAGLVLIDCGFITSQTHHRLLIYDIVRATFSEPAGLDALDDGNEGQEYTGIGSNWIAYTSDFHEAKQVHHLLQWHDGRVISPPQALDRVVDLDTPSGSRRLCRAITRQRGLSSGFAYRERHAIAKTGRLPFPGTLSLKDCDGHKTHLSPAGDDGARSWQLGSRFVVWTDGAHGHLIHSRSIASDRERSWSTPDDAQYTSPLVVQAGRHVIATTVGDFATGFTVFDGLLY